MTNPHTVWIHASATPPDWFAGSPCRRKKAEIRRWHVEDNGWADIAYNWLIDRDGEECGGRDLDHDGDFWEETGAGVKGHNRNTVHICLIGGKGAGAFDAFEDHFTPEQDAALRARIERLKRKFPGIRVRGHNEVAAKGCPGFQVDRWLARKKPARTSVLESKSVEAGTAGIATTAGGAIAAIGGLDGTAQIVALVVAAVLGLLFLFLIRERLKKWARGIR